MDHFNGAFSVFCSLNRVNQKLFTFTVWTRAAWTRERKVQNRFRASLTQTQRNFSTPGAVADTREDGGEGQFVSHQAAVAHAGAPLEHRALHLTVRHAGRRSAGHRWRDKHMEREPSSLGMHESLATLSLICTCCRCCFTGRFNKGIM